MLLRSYWGKASPYRPQLLHTYSLDECPQRSYPKSWRRSVPRLRSPDHGGLGLRNGSFRTFPRLESRAQDLCDSAHVLDKPGLQCELQRPRRVRALEWFELREPDLHT